MLNTEMSFDPRTASFEQQQAMQWAFKEAAEKCRATGITESSCRAVGLPVGTPEDVAARLASLFEQLARILGPDLPAESVKSARKEVGDG
jgi:hypothetical protein